MAGQVLWLTEHEHVLSQVFTVGDRAMPGSGVSDRGPGHLLQSHLCSRTVVMSKSLTLRLAVQKMGIIHASQGYCES